MKPAAFTYHRPQTLGAALEMLATHGDAAKVVAGGQSLVPVMNIRLAAPAHLVDLNDLPGLAAVSDQGSTVEVGALATHAAVAGSALVRLRCPLLSLAAQTIGHYAIRQRGTMGGSLAHADPTAQLPLVAVTLEAEIDLASVRGPRTVRAADFFLSLMTTALAPDELVVAIRFPVAAPGETAAFRLFNRRHGDYAIVAVAGTLRVEQSRIAGLRIGLGGVGPIPAAYDGVCAGYIGQPAATGQVKALAQSIGDAVEPEDGPRISAEFRRELAQTLTERALMHALDESRRIAA